jgi:hypothetical protein
MESGPDLLVNGHHQRRKGGEGPQQARPDPRPQPEGRFWPRDPDGGQGGQDEAPCHIDRQGGPRHCAGAFGEKQAGTEPQFGSDQPADGDGGPRLPARDAGARCGAAFLQCTFHSVPL